MDLTGDRLVSKNPSLGSHGPKCPEIPNLDSEMVKISSTCPTVIFGGDGNTAGLNMNSFFLKVLVVEGILYYPAL